MAMYLNGVGAATIRQPAVDEKVAAPTPFMMGVGD